MKMKVNAPIALLGVTATIFGATAALGDAPPESNFASVLTDQGTTLVFEYRGGEVTDVALYDGREILAKGSLSPRTPAEPDEEIYRRDFREQDRRSQDFPQEKPPERGSHRRSETPERGRGAEDVEGYSTEVPTIDGCEVGDYPPGDPCAKVMEDNMDAIEEMMENWKPKGEPRQRVRGERS